MILRGAALLALWFVVACSGSEPARRDTAGAPLTAIEKQQLDNFVRGMGALTGVDSLYLRGRILAEVLAESIGDGKTCPGVALDSDSGLALVSCGLGCSEAGLEKLAKSAWEAAIAEGCGSEHLGLAGQDLRHASG